MRASPFTPYPTVGSGVPGLAAVANVSYVVLPAQASEGLHKPPHPMFFTLLSGLAHVTLPGAGADDDGLWIEPGVHGLMVAADTVGDGHFTEYPSDSKSVALQIPFADGVLPAHRVVKNGTCERHAPSSGTPLGYGYGQKVVGSAHVLDP